MPKGLLNSTSAGRNRLSELCLDPTKPPEIRARLLLDVLLQNADPNVQAAVLADLFRHTVSSNEAEALQLKEAYQQGLSELQNGPVRPATFLGPAPGDLPTPGVRVHVVTPDGQERYPVLHSRVQPAALLPGMTVYLDAKGSVVLGSTGVLPSVGQEGTFLREVEGGGLLETHLQNDRAVVHAAAPVREALARGDLRAGDRLLVCPRRHVAFAVVPPPADYRHRFVDRTRMSEVVAGRDIGNPHKILDYLVRRLRVFLFRPDLLERFDLRPRCSVLLTGPSGCGKTLTIRAFLSEFDRLLRERTGREDLGSRIVRVKVAELLSEWLGRSDKNIEELFDDIHAIAAQEVKTTQGECLRLPVVVILEEVEGLARQRGRQDSVYDRILTTFLQRLDDPTQDLASLPLILLSTTNRPDLIDAAMQRRLGVHARFGRLDREGLAAVLATKLKPRYPYADGLARKQIIERVVRWMFGAAGDSDGIVALTLDDGRELIKRRRDFLTGGLVEQAVASAIDRLVALAEEATEEVGLSAEALIDALKHVVDSLVGQLTTENAGEYLDLPDNHRVTSVRRLQGVQALWSSTPDDLVN
jgi:ATP-dependent 26S proteasome regulatory subunit